MDEEEGIEPATVAPVDAQALLRRLEALVQVQWDAGLVFRGEDAAQGGGGCRLPTPPLMDKIASVSTLSLLAVGVIVRPYLALRPSRHKLHEPLHLATPATVRPAIRDGRAAVRLGDCGHCHARVKAL